MFRFVTHGTRVNMFGFCTLGIITEYLKNHNQLASNNCKVINNDISSYDFDESRFSIMKADIDFSIMIMKLVM